MKNYEYKFVEVPVAPEKKEDAKGFSPYKICARVIGTESQAEDERHRRERLSGYLGKRKRVKVFASLFQKAVVSKGKAFGRTPQRAKNPYRLSAF